MNVSEEGFIALAASFIPLEPIIDKFCAMRKLSWEHSGRYPRIIMRGSNGSLEFRIYLWMCLDSDGRRFEEFNLQTPFELSGIVELTMENSEVRYVTRTLWQGKEWALIAAELESALHTLCDELLSVTTSEVEGSTKVRGGLTSSK